mmetsp:Transcript_13165/g.33317  ORF Transcript_13165/g.33317 Transcript_13165/m.33317 type:complete len:392 (-) Transcript_13165:386-1561(-)
MPLLCVMCYEHGQRQHECKVGCGRDVEVDDCALLPLLLQHLIDEGVLQDFCVSLLACNCQRRADKWVTALMLGLVAQGAVQVDLIQRNHAARHRSEGPQFHAFMTANVLEHRGVVVADSQCERRQPIHVLGSEYSPQAELCPDAALLLPIPPQLVQQERVHAGQAVYDCHMERSVAMLVMVVHQVCMRHQLLSTEQHFHDLWMAKARGPQQRQLPVVAVASLLEKVADGTSLEQPWHSVYHLGHHVTPLLHLLQDLRLLSSAVHLLQPRQLLAPLGNDHVERSLAVETPQFVSPRVIAQLDKLRAVLLHEVPHHIQPAVEDSNVQHSCAGGVPGKARICVNGFRRSLNELLDILHGFALIADDVPRRLGLVLDRLLVNRAVLFVVHKVAGS